MLDHGQMVAIKRAPPRSLQLSHKFTTEVELLKFTTEVELLSRLRHNNLLDLIGFCVERGEQMLVYDYIPNGSLEDIFFGNTEIQLDWGSRVGIALQSARALAYLHNDANPRVIHRNVKPSNILVDENLTAKVADLGLAKMLPAEPNEGDSHDTTEVVGTVGYLDPEYLSTGQLSVKSDVYGLGIVLLQLITRRRVIDMDSENFDRKIIKNLVKETLESGGIRRLKEELMDPLLRDSVLVGFERFLRLALTCARKQGSQRPSMREVVKELESILDMDMETETETETEGFFQFSPQLRPDTSYIDIDSSSSIEVDISPQPRPDNPYNDIDYSSAFEEDRGSCEDNSSSSILDIDNSYNDIGYSSSIDEDIGSCEEEGR